MKNSIPRKKKRKKEARSNTKLYIESFDSVSSSSFFLFLSLSLLLPFFYPRVSLSLSLFLSFAHIFSLFWKVDATIRSQFMHRNQEKQEIPFLSLALSLSLNRLVFRFTYYFTYYTAHLTTLLIHRLFFSLLKMYELRSPGLNRNYNVRYFVRNEINKR